MTSFYKRSFNRNLLYALAVVGPALFLLSGHILLGLLFLLSVAAARFSRPRAVPSPHRDAHLTKL
jgi:hypothetical protein